ncbi:MAG: hypothetical protein HWN65_06135 [Candidatus Helarchaeota archaeon]|nr:hypothetical protein [Candidatus Helarchaeota archaeon]
MSNIIADLLSLSFIIVLILLTSTFSISLIDENRRRTFGIVAGILTGVAVVFMLLFILGFVFHPEPVV